MFSGYTNNGVETARNYSRSATENAPNGQSFEEIAGDLEGEVDETQTNDYNHEEKTSSTYDLEGESLW